MEIALDLALEHLSSYLAEPLDDAAAQTPGSV
jgi:hypothetical protein